MQTGQDFRYGSTSTLKCCVIATNAPRHLSADKCLACFFFLFFLGIASLCSATTITVPAKNPDYAALFTRFDKQFNNGDAYSHEDNTAGKFGWGQSYFQLAYVRMYRATSNTLWLDKLVTQFDRVLKKRDDQLNRIDYYTKQARKGWGCSNYAPDGRWHVFVVHTGMICKGPAEFVRLVKSDPALQEKYSATADRYLAELEAIVADANSDFKTSGTVGYFVDPSIGDGGIIPLNMSNAMGSVIVELYRITAKPAYKEQATKLANYFRANLHPGNSHSWVWSYWPKQVGEPVKVGEDISHAAVNMDFASRCFLAGKAQGDYNGLVFSQKDMEKFAGTWQLVVKDNTSSQPRYADYVDGRDKPDVNFNPQSAGRWLSILPCLTPHQYRLFFNSVAPAFSGQPIEWPSQALGLANLAWLEPDRID